jgi:hypothetical protein
MRKVGPGCTIGVHLHVTLRHTKVWSTCKVKSFEEWLTQVDRHLLNKSMRHMEDSSSIDSMMKL